MRFVVAFLTVAAAAAAVNIERIPWENLMESSKMETIRTEVPFNERVKYTYMYETIMRVLNPLVPDQQTAIKLNALVELIFKPNGLGFYKVKLEMRDPILKSVVLDPKVTPEPISSDVPLMSEVTTELQKAIFFSYHKGRVLSIYRTSGDQQWSVNMKKGVIHMLNVDVFGKDKITQENAMFTKKEKTIQGLCDSLYTIEKTSPSVMRIKKTIDIATCANKDLVKTLSTIKPEEISHPVESPVKSLTVMNFEVVTKKGSTFKIRQVDVTGTTILFPFGETKDFITTIANQTLKLIKETPLPKNMAPFPSPRQHESLVLRLTTHSAVLKRPSNDDIENLANLVRDTLLHLSKQILDVSSPLTKEATVKIMEVVHMLRPLKAQKELLVVWEKCVDFDTDPKLTSLFIRVLALVKTTVSVTLFKNQLKKNSKQISLPLIEEYLFVLSTPVVTSEHLVYNVKKICELSIVKDNKRILHTCFLTFANLRRLHCAQEKECKIAVPEVLITRLTDCSKVIDPSEMVLERVKEIVKTLIIVESLNEEQLLPVLLKIIKNEHLPMQVRVQAVLAIKPLVRKLKTKVTVPLFKIFRNINLPEELRLAVFACLMETPTPSLIHACAQRMILEPSLTIRRFVFDTLLTMCVPKQWDVEIVQAARLAKDYLRTRKLVPVDLRWIRQHFVKFIKPLPDVILIMKNEIHYTNKTIVPRTLSSKLDAMIWGKQINLVDLNMRFEGIQELFAKMSGVIPKRRLPKDLPLDSKFNVIRVDDEELKVLTTLKVFGKQWISSYKTFTDKPAETFIDKFLPKTYLTWKHLAKALNEGFNSEITKTLMPIELIARIPTCVGIPLVHNLTTIMIHRMTSSVRTETPTLLDIKRLLTSTQKLTVTLNHKQRTILMLRAGLYFEMPNLRCGIQHNKTLNVRFDQKLELNVDMETMKYNIDIELPKSSEIVHVESETESFIVEEGPKEDEQQSSQRCLRIPTLLEDVAPRLAILNTILPEHRRNMTVHLAVEPNQYLSCSDSLCTGLIVSPQREEIIIIKHGPSLVSLFIPKANSFIRINPKTHNIELSKTNPSFLLMKHTSRKEITLQALVRIKSYQLPEDVDLQMKPLHQMVKLLRQAEITSWETEAVYKMIHEDYLKNLVELRNLVIDIRSISVRKTEATPLSLTIIESVDAKLRATARVNALCLGDLSPVCVQAIYPQLKQHLPIFSSLSPMMFKVVLPQNLKKLVIENAVVVNEKKVESTSTISFVGDIPKTSVRISTLYERKEERLNVELKHVKEMEEEENLMCFNVDSKGDKLTAAVSFAPECKTKHLTVFIRPVQQTLPRYSLNIDWKIRTEELPVPLKNVLLFLKDSIILPFMNSPPQLLTGQQVLTDQVFNGTAKLLLPKPDMVKVILRTGLKSLVYMVNLPMSIDTFPVGTLEYPLVARLKDLMMRPVCIHHQHHFKTFDELRYRYEIPNEKCEHILVRDCSKMLPRFLVTVKKTKDLRIVRIILKETEIRIVPTDFKNMPEILIDNVPVRIVADERKELILPNKMHLLIIFEDLTKTLTVFNKELSLKVKIVAGKIVRTSISPLLFGKVCGLCGDMDSEKTYDIRTPEQTLPRDVRLFAMSWMLPTESCKPVPKVEECKSVRIEDRFQCGYRGIKENECVNDKKCCWDSTPGEDSKAPWCFIAQTRTECPIRRTIEKRIVVENVECKPVIKLPDCQQQCKPLKTILLKDVPVKCNNIFKYTDIEVPTDCKCECGLSIIN